MSANDWLAQDIADLLELPVERPDFVETTALGAAMLAAVGAGLHRLARRGRLGDDRRHAQVRAGDGARDGRLGSRHGKKRCRRFSPSRRAFDYAPLALRSVLPQDERILVPFRSS